MKQMFGHFNFFDFSHTYRSVQALMFLLAHFCFMSLAHFCLMSVIWDSIIVLHTSTTPKTTSNLTKNIISSVWQSYKVWLGQRAMQGEGITRRSDHFGIYMSYQYLVYLVVVVNLCFRQIENESHNESVLFKHVRSTVCTVSYYLLS